MRANVKAGPTWATALPAPAIPVPVPALGPVPNPDEVRDTVARVVKMHVDKCPVARSLKGAIEITTELEFR